MTHVPLVLALAALLGAGAGLGAQAVTGHVLEGEHRSDAGTRRYELYVPATGGGERPLVVMLHGCTQTAADFARGTRMNALAEEVGALVLYPEQPATANAQRCWNWYDPAHQRRDAGEPAILAAMTREVAAAHGADARRIYVAGVSAGGAMALTLAATHPDLYAAAGVHSALPLGAARDVTTALVAMREGAPGWPAPVLEAMGERRRPMPLVVFHGEADAVVNPTNARAIVDQWLGATQPALAADGDPVREPERTVERANGLSATRLGLGSDAAPVELWLVAGLGHAWSGGSPEGTYTDARGPDASAELLRFLLACRLPGAAPTPAGAAP